MVLYVNLARRSVVSQVNIYMSEFHEHMTVLPCLAQVISLVGWPKLVKSRSGGCLDRSGDRRPTVM